MSGESAGTLDFAGPQTDAGVDDAGLIIPGTTVHKLTWDDADDSWNFTDPLDVAGNVYLSGDVKVGNNRILASDGGATIVMDTSDNVTVGNDLTVGGTLEVDGNIIKASDGGSTITMDTSDNVTIAGNVTVGGNIIKASDGGSTITMDTSDNVTVAGNVTVGGNIIKASDGGSTITLDTSDNVTIGKFIEMNFDQKISVSEAKKIAEESCKKLLANTVVLPATVVDAPQTRESVSLCTGIVIILSPCVFKCIWYRCNL